MCKNISLLSAARSGTQRILGKFGFCLSAGAKKLPLFIWFPVTTENKFCRYVSIMPIVLPLLRFGRTHEACRQR